MFPEESTLTDSAPLSPSVLSNCLTHTNSPDEFNFTTKPLLPPPVVKMASPTPGSKSAALQKVPAMYVLPLESTETEVSEELVVLNCLAHTNSPDEFNFTT